MGESFVCVNGIDMEAALAIAHPYGWTDVHEQEMQEILTAALGECIPTTVENDPANDYYDFDRRRWLSAWQPVEEDTDQ